MSVAYELFPCEYLDSPGEDRPWEDGPWKDGPAEESPGRRRPAAGGGRPELATVSVLHAPQEIELGAPLRLTGRGRFVLAFLVAAVGAAFVWLASGSTAPASTEGKTPATVTVESGDTLWSIASRVAPNTDPREAVASLQQRNHLLGAHLVPGQVLQLR